MHGDMDIDDVVNGKRKWEIDKDVVRKPAFFRAAVSFDLSSGGRGVPI